MLEIRACAVAEIVAAETLPELLEQYAVEGSLPEIGAPMPQLAAYEALEATGMLRAVGAYDDGRLVGFLVLTTVVLPHYGVPAATVESLFVAPDARKLGVGLRLLAAGESIARDVGSKAMLVSAPVGGSLSKVLAAKGSYRHSNDVFVRAL